ncbi:MAG TPA: heterodisulfide reductase-related iron-sulfur binding cluster [Candidatus Binatia bacterium]|nr:heterodisulfide reductase-related iron-sulfur binding cluster [Candidatus Binatia bacterium]
MAESIGVRIADPKFWDAADLRSEIDRVFNICDSCRLCFKFCGSFPRLFEAIDGRTEANRARHLAEHPELIAEAERRRAQAEASGPRVHEEGVEAAEAFGDELPELAAHARDLSRDEIDRVADLCFQCKLCYPNCPYTPPHEYAVDFPRLILRWNAQRARRQPPSLAKRILRNPVLVGRLASLTPRLARFGMTNRASRWAMEKLLGVHRDKDLPPVHRETFPRWWREHVRTPRPTAVAATNGSPDAATTAGELPRRVVLFSTCLVDYNDPGTGRAAVKVLEHNGIEVAWPEGQACCGMPRLDGGELERAAEQARANVALLQPWVARGYAVVVPSPSCSLMMREEVPQLVATPEGRAVAAATHDLCDYLFKLGRAGGVRKEFVRRLGRVKYHVPCHIRAQQIGYRGRDVLRWVSEGIDLVQECSGHDGTWSMWKENFHDSLRWGRKCFEGMKPAVGEACSAACTDCALAALQIRQGAGVTAIHPVVALAYAYGFDVGDAAAHLAPATGEAGSIPGAPA